MKLSSLNKFKGRKVTVRYLDRDDDREIVIENGIIDDVTEDYITVEDEDGLTNITHGQVLGVYPNDKKAV